MPVSAESADKFIEIKGARVHNLKNIDLRIPRNKFIVITGLSGSGKSSLAFDTLYAEGQRRYVESLSSYARQFLGRIDKPDVDMINGIPPAIAIEQKVNTRNPRSTVGTSTEIYDYLKLLYARIGKTYSPISGRRVKKHAVTDVVNFMAETGPGSELIILSPYLFIAERDVREQMELLLKQGITRLQLEDGFKRIEDMLKEDDIPEPGSQIPVVIDRIKVQLDEDSLARYADSVQTAFSLGKGECHLQLMQDDRVCVFSDSFEMDGMKFDEPDVHMFSFNNPVGACHLCEGYGKIIGIDEDLVIPNKSLSIYEDAIVCWKGEKMSKWKEKLVLQAAKFDFPIHKPFYQLTPDQKRLLWTGNRYFKGLDAFFRHLEEKKYKIQYRVMLSRYRGKTTCPACQGTRLKKEASYVKVNKRPIQDLVIMPVTELYEFFRNIRLTRHETEIAGRILKEIHNRLGYLVQVGLGYLTLNRLSSTLSGGESQRINLATSLGSSLVGSMYILDEPSIGLHPRDTHLLIGVLKNLEKLGNTVLVVEHDEDIIRSSAHIIDMGPMAGRLGGEVVFQGDPDKLDSKHQSLTARYLTGEELIKVSERRRKWHNYIELLGARENNLKGIDVKFPLNIMAVVTGVSGSGKSSLVSSILYPALLKKFHGHGEKPGEHDLVRGDIQMLDGIEMVDQHPIGKSSRSNPVTYLKAFDEIRRLYADQQAAVVQGFKASHFSFNIDGGRCEECQGEGIIKVEMQFMADVHLICDSCHGKRFKDEILDVRYRGKNIYDLLECTVDEAIEFFSEAGSHLGKRICERLKPLADVGLGYIKLGQSSSTLSGGESQRVKLASFLSRENSGRNLLFLFDEPTTGLHFHDIRKLLDAFQELISKGHSLVIIEHNLEVIKSADWIIDLGPEGGEEGGEIIFEGTPEDLSKHPTSYTGKFLRSKL
ncbi:MAG: excinuclease ABC subunit A [Bacteroides sp. SM1_62]|nr:MAG: excinuclease ABC subunit A [Bacteroides sp. SM1_62]